MKSDFGKYWILKNGTVDGVEPCVWIKQGGISTYIPHFRIQHIEWDRGRTPVMIDGKVRRDVEICSIRVIYADRSYIRFDRTDTTVFFTNADGAAEEAVTFRQLLAFRSFVIAVNEREADGSETEEKS